MSGESAPQLYQAEWCPHSHRVRQRLTELGVDYVARQVPADPDARDAMERATGRRSIPTLVFPDGEVVSGDDAIVAALGTRYGERPDGEAHRRKLADEWPDWQRLHGA